MGWTTFMLGVPRVGDLDQINERVNARIEGRDADATKPWRIIAAEDAILDGCCHDYAVTKRAELLGRGWPRSRLLLAEVGYSTKEDHMVLIAVLDNGEQMVLDNLRPITPWSASGYHLIRRQSAADPNLWES